MGDTDSYQRAFVSLVAHPKVAHIKLNAFTFLINYPPKHKQTNKTKGTLVRVSLFIQQAMLAICKSCVASPQFTGFETFSKTFCLIVRSMQFNILANPKVAYTKLNTFT